MNIKYSEDNKCGPSNNYTTCPRMQCCSDKGWCGENKDYCYDSKNKEYGNKKISKNGQCGPSNNNTRCPAGLCCSVNGWCGDNNYYCNSINEKYDGKKIRSTDKKCGPDNKYTMCVSKECCSKNGICGSEKEFCDNNTNSKYNGIDNNTEIFNEVLLAGVDNLNIPNTTNTINYLDKTSDNRMNLELLDFNIDNYSKLTPKGITVDQYATFIKEAKYKLFDDTTFPYTKDINESKINGLVENTILKRACCMRKFKDDKNNTINVNLYDKVDKKIKPFSIYIDKLDEKCMILSQDFSPKSLSCDNFYKAYCKMLKSYNYDLTSDLENYNKNIKYSSNKDNTNGLECSCLNSPLYEYNNDQIKENTIYHMDKACINGVNNNTSYETDTISKNKVSTLNICSINLGNYSEAANMYIS